MKLLENKLECCFSIDFLLLIIYHYDYIVIARHSMQIKMKILLGTNRI